MAEKLYRTPESLRTGSKLGSRNEKRNDFVANPETELSLSYSSSSSSYLDISREYPISPRKGIIRTFFTAPSERRRLRRQRSRRILPLNNSSSSSINTDLAYGTGFLKVKKQRHRRKQIRREKGKQKSDGTDAAILALGAGLAAVAKKQNVEDLKASRRTEIFNASGRRSRTSYDIVRGNDSPRSARDHDQIIVEEEDWESASEADSEASSYIDSTLAFGGESSRQRAKSSVVDPGLFGPANSLHGYVTEPVGFEYVDPNTVGVLSPLDLRTEHYEETRFTERIQLDETINARQPLQTVFPIPTNDPTRFEVTRASAVSAEEPLIVRPGPVPLQQPQPKTPVSHMIYDQTAELDSRAEKRSSSYGKSIAGAALAGMAGVAVGSMIAKDRANDRKSSSGSDREERRKLKDRDGDRSEGRSKRSDKDDTRSHRSSKRESRDEKVDREEKRIVKKGDSPPRDRREKRREKRRDSEREEDHEERRARRREERRAERASIAVKDERYNGVIEPSTAKGAVDPFQFQVAEDAFPTPDGSKVMEVSGFRKGRDPYPTVYTVEREPDFSKMRSPTSYDSPELDRGPPYPRDDYRRGDRNPQENREPYGIEVIHRENEHSTDAAVSAAFAAQVAAAAAAGAFRGSRSERRRGERRSSRNYYEDKDRFEDDQDRIIQEDADRAYRESVIARKVASRVIRERSSSPDVVHKYRRSSRDEPEEVRIVTPPAMEEKRQPGPYDAPNADFELDRVMDPTEFKRFSAPQIITTNPVIDSYQSPKTADYDNTRFGAAVGHRPLLNLVRPTPSPSPAPLKQSTSSDPTPDKRSKQRSRSQSVDDFVIDNKGNAQEAPVPSPSIFSKAVTWGPNETKHYEVESPGEIQDEFISSPPRETSKSVPEQSAPKSGGWGVVASAIMGAAAGASMAKSDAKKSPETKPSNGEGYSESRRFSREPEDYQAESRQSPPATGPKPTATSMPGSFADDIDFTATLAAGLQDSGFDPNIVIDDPTYRKRTSPPGSDEDLGSSYRQPFAETVSDLGQGSSKLSQENRVPTQKSSAPETQSRNMSGENIDFRNEFISKPDPIENDPESYAEPPKLSKREQKKRDKAARTQGSGPIDRSAPLEETPLTSEVVSEPAGYFETPKKSKSKKPKRNSLKYEDDDKTETTPQDISPKVSVPIDAFDDIINAHAGTPNGTDDWSTPSHNSKRTSKRDSGRRDSPLRAQMQTDIEVPFSRDEAEPDPSAFPLPMSTISDPEPADFPLPMSTMSQVSRNGHANKGDTRKSIGDSGILDSPSDKYSQSVVPGETSRYDEEEPRNSKKSSRSGRRHDDDTRSRSVASAPAYDDNESGKKSKRRSKGGSRFEDDDARSTASAPTYEYDDGKKGKKSGILGLFGISSSKSEPEKKRDESAKFAVDDLDEPKKKRKSKRSSIADSSELYENDGESSKTNGNGHQDGDDNDNDDLRSSRRRHRSKDEKRKSTQDDKDSFLANAGTLGAGVGLAGAAMAYAAHHLQHEAKHTNPSGADLTLDTSNPPSDRKLDDTEITRRPFRPSIDPQYGDLLPLPPSDSSSPELGPSLGDLPQLPDSRPETPESDRRKSRERSMLHLRRPENQPLKSPSQSAVPLRFVLNSNRSGPASPDGTRSSVFGQTGGGSPEAVITPRARPRPTSWDSTKEFKALYLVQHNRHGSSSSLTAEDQPPTSKDVEPESNPLYEDGQGSTSKSVVPSDGKEETPIHQPGMSLKYPSAFEEPSPIEATSKTRSSYLLQDTPPSKKHSSRLILGEDSPTPVERDEPHDVFTARNQAFGALSGSQVNDLANLGLPGVSDTQIEDLEHGYTNITAGTDAKVDSIPPTLNETSSSDQSSAIRPEQNISVQQPPTVPEEAAQISAAKSRKDKKGKKSATSLESQDEVGASIPMQTERSVETKAIDVTEPIVDESDKFINQQKPSGISDEPETEPQKVEMEDLSPTPMSKPKKGKKQRGSVQALESDDPSTSIPTSNVDEPGPFAEFSNVKSKKGKKKSKEPTIMQDSDTIASSSDPTSIPPPEENSRDLKEMEEGKYSSAGMLVAAIAAAEMANIGDRSKSETQATPADAPLNSVIQAEQPPDGLAVGYKEDQLALAKQLQEEFGSGSSKKSKKGKKKAQSGAQTPDVPTPSREGDSFFDGNQDRGRGLEDVTDSLETGYKNEQLELARQLQAEFGSENKKSKKDKKKSRSTSRPATDDFTTQEPGEEPFAGEPSTDPALAENPSETQPKADCLEAGYKEDQLQFARDLQASFSAGSKKKKDKKRRSTSQTPTEDLEPGTPNVDDSSNALESRGLECDSTSAEPTSLDAPSNDAFASGYNEEQLALAKQLKEEFGNKSKPSKKDKKRQSLLRFLTFDNSNPDSFDEASQSSGPSTPYAETSNVVQEAKGAESDEGFGSSKKSKKDKKKRRSQLQNETASDSASNAPLSLEQADLPADSGSAQGVSADAVTAATEPEQESFTTSKKSKKEKKKRQSQLQSEPTNEPVTETSQSLALAGLPLENEAQAIPIDDPAVAAEPKEELPTTSKEYQGPSEHMFYSATELPLSSRLDNSVGTVIADPSRESEKSEKEDIKHQDQLEPESIQKSNENLAAESTSQPVEHFAAEREISTDPIITESPEEFTSISKKSKEKKKRQSQVRAEFPGEESSDTVSQPSAIPTEEVSNEPRNTADSTAETILPADASTPEQPVDNAVMDPIDYSPYSTKKSKEDKKKRKSQLQLPSSTEASSAVETPSAQDLESASRDIPTQDPTVQGDVNVEGDPALGAEPLARGLNGDGWTQPSEDKISSKEAMVQELEPLVQGQIESLPTLAESALTQNVEEAPKATNVSTAELKDPSTQTEAKEHAVEDPELLKLEDELNLGKRTTFSGTEDSKQPPASPLENAITEQSLLPIDTATEAAENRDPDLFSAGKSKKDKKNKKKGKVTEVSPLESGLETIRPPLDVEEEQDSTSKAAGVDSGKDSTTFTSKRSKKDKKKGKSKSQNDLDDEPQNETSTEQEKAIDTSTDLVESTTTKVPVTSESNESPTSRSTVYTDGAALDSLPSTKDVEADKDVVAIPIHHESTPIPPKESADQPFSSRGENLERELAAITSDNLASTNSDDNDIAKWEAAHMTEPSSQPDASANASEPLSEPPLPVQTESADQQTNAGRTNFESPLTPVETLNDLVDGKNNISDSRPVDEPAKDDSFVTPGKKSKKDKEKKRGSVAFENLDEETATGSSTPAEQEIGSSGIEDGSSSQPVVEPAAADEPTPEPADDSFGFFSSKKSKKDKKKKRGSVATDPQAEVTPGSVTPVETMVQTNSHGNAKDTLSLPEPTEDSNSQFVQPVTEPIEDDFSSATRKESNEDNGTAKDAVTLDPQGNFAIRASTPTETATASRSLETATTQPLAESSDPSSGQPISEPTEEDFTRSLSKKSKKDKKKKRASGIFDPEENPNNSTPIESPLNPESREIGQTERSVASSKDDVLISNPYVTTIEGSNLEDQSSLEPSKHEASIAERVIESRDVRSPPIEDFAKGEPSILDVLLSHAEEYKPIQDKDSTAAKPSELDSLLGQIAQEPTTGDSSSAANSSKFDDILNRSMDDPSKGDSSVPPQPTVAFNTHEDSTDQHGTEATNEPTSLTRKMSKKDKKKRKSGLNQQSDTDNAGTSTPIDQEPSKLEDLKISSAAEQVQDEALASSMEQETPRNPASEPADDEFGFFASKKSKKDKKKRKSGLREVNDASLGEPSTRLEPAVNLDLQERSIPREVSEPVADPTLSTKTNDKKSAEPVVDSAIQEKPASEEPAEPITEYTSKAHLTPGESAEQTTETPQGDALHDQSSTEIAALEDEDSTFSTNKKSKKDKKKRQSGLGQQDGVESAGASTPTEVPIEPIVPEDIVSSTAVQPSIESVASEENVLSRPSAEIAAPEEDEFGFSTSKKSKKDKKKRKSGLTQQESADNTGTSTPAEQTVVPVIQEETAEMAPFEEPSVQKVATQQSNEIAAPEEDEFGFNTSKKSKKDKKKKKGLFDLSNDADIPSSATAAGQLVGLGIGTALGTQIAEDEWGLSSDKKSKKDKKKKGKAEVPDEANVEGTSTAADVSVASERGIDRSHPTADVVQPSNEVVDSTPATGPVPDVSVAATIDPEHAPSASQANLDTTANEPADDEWGSIPRKKSKKDKKKRKGTLDLAESAESSTPMESMTPVADTEQSKELSLEATDLEVGDPKDDFGLFASQTSKKDVQNEKLFDKSEDPATTITQLATAETHSKLDQIHPEDSKAIPDELNLATRDNKAVELSISGEPSQQTQPIEDDWGFSAGKKSKKDKKKRKTLDLSDEFNGPGTSTPSFSNDQLEQLVGQDTMPNEEQVQQTLAKDGLESSISQNPEKFEEKQGLDSSREIDATVPSARLESVYKVEAVSGTSQLANSAEQDKNFISTEEDPSNFVKLSKKDKKRKSLLTPSPITTSYSIPEVEREAATNEKYESKELQASTANSENSDFPKDSPAAGSEFGSLSRKSSKKSKKRGKTEVDQAAAKVVSDELASSPQGSAKFTTSQSAPDDASAPPLKRGHFELSGYPEPDLATPDAESVNPLLRAKFHGSTLRSITESTKDSTEPLEDKSGKSSSAAKIGASVGLGVVAGLAAKFEGSKADTKKSKKGKKKAIDNRTSNTDDIFDDPVLWEGVEKTVLTELTSNTEADTNDDFWTAPTEAPKEEVLATDAKASTPVTSAYNEPALTKNEVNTSRDIVDVPVSTPSLAKAGLEDSSSVPWNEVKFPAKKTLKDNGEERAPINQAEPLTSPDDCSELRIPKTRSRNTNGQKGTPGPRLQDSIPPISVTDWPQVTETSLQIPSAHSEYQPPALDPNRDSTLVDGSPIPLQRGFEHEYIRDSGVQLQDWSTPQAERKTEAVSDRALKRLSWPRVDDDTETVDLARPHEPSIKAELDKHIDDIALGVAVATGSAAARQFSPTKEHFHVRQHLRRTPSPRSLGLVEKSQRSQSPGSLGPVPKIHTPDHSRAPSAASVRSLASNISSATPPLRRTDRQKSSDLRSLSQRSEASSVKQAELELRDNTENNKSISTTGQVHVQDMADVYDGYGEGRIGSPISPTRPPSMRRRQSMKVLDLEAQLHELAEENRMLSEGKTQAEQSLYAAQRATATLADRDAEIDSLKQTIEWLHREVSRLTEVNEGLSSANVTMGNQHDQRYDMLEAQHNQTTRELQELRQSHGTLSVGMDGVVHHELDNTLEEKNREIAQLYAELDAAKEQIRELQRQILAAKANDSDFLTIRDEDYFDNACQQLCSYVQQWVLRFSKFSDMRACRLTSEINNEKIVNRLDNAVLDGSDVDHYLADRVKRRDIFMSMTMMMVWEFVFTRYLFGMDREQRQKLKSLEKILAEVGPQRAVHQWRATTLTLLAKREAFLNQREQDTEAVVQEIFNTLSEILPPPSQLEDQIQEQLRKVMKVAVDLSIEMRTQRAEYMMLPPLQPEYDANGDLAHKFPFNAALMNERSGDTISNEDLEQQGAVVRVVLFPLVVKKGDDRGEGDEEIVVCPAQVLVAKDHKRRSTSGRVISGGGGHSGAGVMGGHNASKLSVQSSMPGVSVLSRDGSPF